VLIKIINVGFFVSQMMLEAFYRFKGVNICCKVLNLGLCKFLDKDLKPNTKLTPFVVSKDEWDTKKGPGKSMKNGLYV